MPKTDLKNLAKLIRYHILTSTTEAGSGHPTSSLSATDLMTVLMFGGFFKFDLNNPNYHNNDRLIFSKGHASPLFYALWAAAGKIKEEELMTLRKFDSRLEGHPTMVFPYTEAATGSLGQGLSVGVGMAINAKYLDKMPYKTYVLLGDSEMAEGSVWEAMEAAAFYKLNNLVGIIDVNRLGQRGETRYGHNLKIYADKIKAFGWQTITVDGHNIAKITEAFKKAQLSKDKPIMIIAKTLKGKGVSFIEDKDGWHGKALKKDELEKALLEIGKVDKKLVGKVSAPQKKELVKKQAAKTAVHNYKKNELVATRKAYGNALLKSFQKHPEIVVLDAETSNSTFAETFKKIYPNNFFEMYIAEQNMAGCALGLSRRGKIPFVSTFAAFFSRCYDQIRMGQYSNANIKFVGSHAGVHIGEDGASQMGLEDIAMFRSIIDSVILYPSDAISTEKLVEQSAKHKGMVYFRTTRQDTPVLYDSKETFEIGGSKTLHTSHEDVATIISAGITLFEALAAHEELKKEGIHTRVIDLYSIKPLDITTLEMAARQTKAIITVEDHHLEGGIGEAVVSALSHNITPVYKLAVKKMPKSGKPDELLNFEEISRKDIIKKVKEAIK